MYILIVWLKKGEYDAVYRFDDREEAVEYFAALIANGRKASLIRTIDPPKLAYQTPLFEMEPTS